MNVTTQMGQPPLDHRIVGDIRGTFFVPAYQRGYRWDTGDVERLLNDIWRSNGQTYSLQPIVVKKIAEGNEQQGGRWELIDGQQRLTTLYLILHFMQQQGWKKNGARYDISYETRPNSAAYLKTLDESYHKANIDFFHLYTAYECIRQWFSKSGDEFAQEDAANTVHGYLTKHVRVIWYEAPETMGSTALFTRLNVGRIPLTDAELVKALLLSSVRRSSTDRAHELAAQWDTIERDLQNPDVWAFVANADPSGDADRYATRISLLLDTLAPLRERQQPGRKRPRFYTFETLREQVETQTELFWNSVQSLHALILGWFSKPSLYNKIGYLVTTGDSFGEIVNLAKGQRKRTFENDLDSRISKKINVSSSEIRELRYGNPKIADLLLLFNVEAASRTEQRFPFRLHVGKAWSLEHIHAQNADELTTAKQWTPWLELHKAALNAFPGQQNLQKEIDEALAVVGTARNFGSIFKELAARVLAVFDAPASGASASSEEIHSIGNLALISRGDNSALSNSVFEVKRQRIIGMDREGSYIPTCTRNVFMKYYADPNDVHQIHFWGPQDRESYFNEIVSRLSKYFKAEELTN